MVALRKSSTFSQKPSQSKTIQTTYDDDFFDDILGIFPDASGYAPKAGWCSKHIYDNNNWNDVMEHSDSYYAPRGDQELTEQAIKNIDEWNIPKGTTFIDYGVGCSSSFMRYAMPVIQKMESKEYVGVDFCSQALKAIQLLDKKFVKNLTIKTEQMDLFFPTTKTLSKKPALGVMNGLTLANLYGKQNSDTEINLVAILKYLSQLCGHGWLLLTVDTNQNAEFLRKSYATPALSRLFLSALFRMSKELPTNGFDPSLFEYYPDYRPAEQLLAHTARATKNQDFKLGPYPIHVEKGQKIHLVNSYKWRREFFEACARKANLSILKSWDHETGMMLYLLRDNLNAAVHSLAA